MSMTGKWQSPKGNNDQSAADRADARLWNDLKIPVPPWEPEANAPEIDQDLIRKVIENRGTDQEEKLILSLLLRFRSWVEAYIQQAEIWKANRSSPSRPKELGSAQAVDDDADEL